LPRPSVNRGRDGFFAGRVADGQRRIDMPSGMQVGAAVNFKPRQSSSEFQSSRRANNGDLSLHGLMSWRCCGLLPTNRI